MADALVSRLGQVNIAGDAKALFLKVFAGEILTEFEARQVTMGLHTVRSISHGKSASFPVIGRAAATYHTPGQSLLDTSNGYLNQIGANEKIIYIDDLLTAPVFISNIDEAMNHYDVRGPYATELGRALAYKFDKNVLQTAVLAARQTTPAVTGGDVGTVINAGLNAADNTSDALVEAIYEAGQALDEKNIPEEDRVCIVRPAQYWALLKSDKAINRDFDGRGSIGAGKVWEIGGIQIVKSNHLPSTVIAAAAGENNTYDGTFTDTMALVMNKEAVGTLKLMDLAVESEYVIQNQGWFTVAKYAIGHGELRPECAVEITKAV